mmetsp:Transcript_41884/g.68704  ORF Transcript_41884/g.68704 Transcript_41884/m.68704 type:complete len:260 (+) Transcript_41884:40-819(+)
MINSIKIQFFSSLLFNFETAAPAKVPSMRTPMAGCTTRSKLLLKEITISLLPNAYLAMTPTTNHPRRPTTTKKSITKMEEKMSPALSNTESSSSATLAGAAFLKAAMSARSCSSLVSCFTPSVVGLSSSKTSSSSSSMLPLSSASWLVALSSAEGELSFLLFLTLFRLVTAPSSLRSSGGARFSGKKWAVRRAEPCIRGTTGNDLSTTLPEVLLESAREKADTAISWYITATKTKLVKRFMAFIFAPILIASLRRVEEA